MASTSRRYSSEMRERAVRLVLESGRPIAAVAADLGIGAESLRTWVRQARTDAGGDGARLTSSEREELAGLRREVKDLRRANEILKAASVFFVGELDHSHPGAAASLREGMDETLTLTRLGVSGALKRTLESTNPCESMIECVRRSSRNVKHWQSGDMALRWTAAGMLEAECQFRRIIGHTDLAKLAVIVERDLARHRQQQTHTTTEEAATLVA